MGLPDVASSVILGPWLDEYIEFASRLPQNEPAALAQLRNRAIAGFRENGFPSTALEAWRSTDISEIAQTPYRRVPSASVNTSPVDVVPFSYVMCGELVFFDGHYAQSFSSICDLPEDAVLGNLRDAIRTDPDKVQTHLGGYVPFEENAFAALNTAFIKDGAFLHVPRDTIMKEPIHLLYLTTGHENPTASYPRNLIVVGENSQVTIIESYAGPEHGSYLTCPVTEIVAGEGADIEHYKIQHESAEAAHMASQHIYLSRKSHVVSQSMSFGGGYTRNDIGATLNGEGADCTLNGLYLPSGTQFVDHHISVEHTRPGCRSFQLFKGILEDSARAVFNGLIHVHPDAQQTSADQSNRNLLLSRDALVHSQPQLLIFADDVKCTHGSTVGELDQEALFYLRSRGIGEEEARSLLIYAFASEFIERIEFSPVKKDLEKFLINRLPHGEIIRQAM